MNSFLLPALDQIHSKYRHMPQSPRDSPQHFSNIHVQVAPIGITSRYHQEDNNKKRQDCIDELINTEKQYIEDLSVIKMVFEMPFKASNVINLKEMENIFVNLDDILDCNRNFLDDLLEKVEFDDDIGIVICNNIPKMLPYVHFCKRQLDSASYLQNVYENSSTFREILRKCQSNPILKGMPLSSFLLKPMQRITKYPLLIGKILENTPDNHPDYKNLIEARAMADKFLKRINENMRLKEDYERLIWLQEHIAQNELNINFNGNTNKLGPRTLIHYGALTKVKSGKELLGFLLNDFLLLVQPSKSGQFNFQRNTNVTYKVYKQPLMIHEIQILKAPIESIENLAHADRIFYIQQDGKPSVTLLTTSANDCNLWIKRIEIAKEMYDKAMSLSRTKLRTKATGPQQRGRLIVQVVKGSRFIITGRSFVQNVYCKVALGETVQNTNVAMDERNGNVLNGIPQPPTLIWNDCMQFPIFDLDTDVLSLVVYEMCPFSPDEFLGRAELKMSDLHGEWLMRKLKEPITKKLILHNVESGEVVVKYDLQLFDKY